MASIAIRNLDDEVWTRLRVRACGAHWTFSMDIGFDCNEVHS